MRLDLDLSYPHCPFTAEPNYVGIEIAEGVAMSARQQMGLEDGSRLAVDLDLLMSVEAVRVNGVAYNLHWHIGGPLTDENGEPVLGVCEHDPDGVPDAALISINPDVVGGREEVILSTAVHEKGHGFFEAPKWILETQRTNTIGLPGINPNGPRRVHRTITPDENHLAAAPARGSPEFFEEVRANAFMGAFLAPIHRASMRGFATIVGASGFRRPICSVSIRRCYRSGSNASPQRPRSAKTILRSSIVAFELWTSS
jgi:hypothetical protein